MDDNRKDDVVYSLIGVFFGNTITIITLFYSISELSEAENLEDGFGASLLLIMAAMILIGEVGIIVKEVHRQKRSKKNEESKKPEETN